MNRYIPRAGEWPVGFVEAGVRTGEGLLCRAERYTEKSTELTSDFLRKAS